MSSSIKHFYEFGPFRLDVANRLLLRGGAPVPLTPKAVETLLALVRNGGEVIRKDDLMKLVWPGQFVEEGNLTQHIYLLRNGCEAERHVLSHHGVDRHGHPVDHRRGESFLFDTQSI